MDDVLLEAVHEAQFILLGEWVPRLLAYTVTATLFVSIQTFFSRWILKLKSTKFTVANLFTAITLVTLAFDGTFISSKPFYVMCIGMILFWGIYLIGDLIKEVTEIKLNIGSVGIHLRNRRTDDNKKPLEEEK